MCRNTLKRERQLRTELEKTLQFSKSLLIQAALALSIGGKKKNHTILSPLLLSKEN